MFTQAYWEEKVLLMMEEYNPKLYRKLNNQKELNELTEKLGAEALNLMNQMYENLKKTHLPANQSPQELTTAEWENQSTAREMVEETLMSTIMSMTA